jgi:alpha/beta superfamily hydrolase
MTSVVQVDILGPAGRLEALLEQADAAAPRFAAVVCHPHPRHGGTMHNHATYRLAKAVRGQGGVSVRFNYRGVGRSAGQYDLGRGEADDTAAALSWLASERPSLPLLACGFSFGAWTAARAGGLDPRVRGLLLAGLAIRSPDLDRVRDAASIPAIEKPVAVIQAAQDELGAPSEIEPLLAGSQGPRRFVVIPRCTHLFTEDLGALQREAEEAIAWLLGERP